MNQTLKNIRNFVSLREVSLQEVASRDVAPPNKVDFIKRLKLQSVVTHHTIPTNKIAERAFSIWQERGGSHGNDFEDWLLAKIQLEDELVEDELN